MNKEVTMLERKTPLEAELEKIKKQEDLYIKKHTDTSNSKLNQLLENKVPEKLQETLNAAFCKAFFLIFEKGTGIIEKTYKKEKLETDFKINMYTATLKRNRKALKIFSKKASGAANVNLVLCGVSGVGLGVLGIGIPDIALFTGLLLKSLYEMSLHYGFNYEDTKERQFILLLIQGALSHNEEFLQIDREINLYTQTGNFSAEPDIDSCITNTASCLSRELLYMKFLQGIPIIGAVGGAFDAIYMKRVNKFAELKYRRRFLLEQLKNQ